MSAKKIEDRSVETIRVTEIRVGERYRRDLGDIDALATSIGSIGLLHPIVITRDRRLIAGARRLAAMRLLERETVPATVVTNLDDAVGLLLAQSDENKQRKNLTPTEAVALARALKPLAQQGGRARSADVRSCSRGNGSHRERGEGAADGGPDSRTARRDRHAGREGTFYALG